MQLKMRFDRRKFHPRVMMRLCAFCLLSVASQTRVSFNSIGLSNRQIKRIGQVQRAVDNAGSQCSDYITSAMTF